MFTQNRRAFLNFTQRPSPPIDECWLHVHRTAMACRFEVTLSMSEQSGVVVATEALDEIDRLEEQLTVFRQSSEVSKVNRSAAQGSVHIERSLFDLLVLCKDLYQQTDGAFDITSGPLTRCWGFLKREGRLPAVEDLKEAQSVVGSDNLLLDSESRTIRFARPGVEINLGSIGKGWALDKVAKEIAKEIQSALLNAGSSSFRAIGAGGSAQDGWVVGLRDPRSKVKRLGIVRLRDCAMSTSGSEEQYFEHAGKRYGHIIDPRTGWPAASMTSVTVVANSTAMTDALATAFYVGGRELAERYCSAHANVMAIVLEPRAAAPVVIGHHVGCVGLEIF